LGELLRFSVRECKVRVVVRNDLNGELEFEIIGQFDNLINKWGLGWKAF
jgi:hypothetical protein